MRAAVYRRYGPPEVVAISEIPRPEPKADEVLVRVKASTVSAADWRLRKADPFFARCFNGLLRPQRFQVLGMEFAGVVEAVGEEVTQFRPGDKVFGLTGIGFGTHAEYLVIPQSRAIAKAPSNLKLEECAALLFGGMTALSFLSKAGIAAGQKVLIYGASGSVGVAAIQIAKHLGAQVTAVCSGPNLELVRSLGADEVVDYTREDFARSGPVYDIVFDTVGHAGIERAMSATRRGGCYATCAWAGFGMVLAPLTARLRGLRAIVGGVAGESAETLRTLVDMASSGELKPVVERRYPLERIVEAHRLAESGRKKGNVLVLMGGAA